jgi:hypothetical protein
MREKITKNNRQKQYSVDEKDKSPHDKNIDYNDHNNINDNNTNGDGGNGEKNNKDSGDIDDNRENSVRGADSDYIEFHNNVTQLKQSFCIGLLLIFYGFCDALAIKPVATLLYRSERIRRAYFNTILLNGLIFIGSIAMLHYGVIPIMAFIFQLDSDILRNIAPGHHCHHRYHQITPTSITSAAMSSRVCEVIDINHITTLRHDTLYYFQVCIV